MGGVCTIRRLQDICVLGLMADTEGSAAWVLEILPSEVPVFIALGTLVLSCLFT